MTRHQVTLPDLGLDSQPVSAGMWLVNGGRRVARGDQLIEILSGSLVVDLPSPADGVLVEKLVEEGSPLHAGQLLAVIRSVED